MIEILLLRAFYGHLADTAAEKNRTRLWGWLGVLLWFGGEVTGFCVAGVDGGLESYGMALVVAAVGAAVAYLVVKSLSVLPPKDFPVATVRRGGGA